MVIILCLIICNIVFCNDQSPKKGNKVICKEDFQRATKGIKESINKTKEGINNVYQNTKKKINDKKNKKDPLKNNLPISLKEQKQTFINPDQKCNYKDFYDTVFKYENTEDDYKIVLDTSNQKLASSYYDIKNDNQMRNVQRVMPSIDNSKSDTFDTDNHMKGNQLTQKKTENKNNSDKSLQDIYKKEFINSHKHPDCAKQSALVCKTQVIEIHNDKETTDNANSKNCLEKTNSNVKRRKNNSKNMKEISSVSKLTPGNRASYLADKVIYKDIDYSIEPSYIVPIRDHKFKEIRKTFQKETSYSKTFPSAIRSINLETQDSSTEEHDIKRKNYVQESAIISTSSTFEQSDTVTNAIVSEKTDKKIETLSFAKLLNTNKELVSVKILQEKFNNNTTDLSLSKSSSINSLSTINEENVDVNFKSNDQITCILASSAKRYEENCNQEEDDKIIQNNPIFNSSVFDIVTSLTEENCKDGPRKIDENSFATNLSEINNVKTLNKTTNEENFIKTMMIPSVIKLSGCKFEEEQNVYANNITEPVFKHLILSKRHDPEITEHVSNDICFDKKSDINELLNLFEDKRLVTMLDENAKCISRQSEGLYSIDFIKEVNINESSDNTNFKKENNTGDRHKHFIFCVIVGVSVICITFFVFILLTFK